MPLINYRFDSVKLSPSSGSGLCWKCAPGRESRLLLLLIRFILVLCKCWCM